MCACVSECRREYHSFDGITTVVQKYADWLAFSLGRPEHKKGSQCVAVDGLSVILKVRIIM